MQMQANKRGEFIASYCHTEPEDLGGPGHWFLGRGVVAQAFTPIPPLWMGL